MNIVISDDFIRIIIVLMFHPGNCALKRKVHLPNGCIVAQKQLPTRESYLELPLFNDIGASFDSIESLQYYYIYMQLIKIIAYLITNVILFRLLSRQF